MDRDNMETPTVEEIKNQINSRRLIRSHVKKYTCPDCGTETFFTYSDGWNNRYECDGCGESFKYIG